jgi:MFS family permease
MHIRALIAPLFTTQARLSTQDRRRGLRLFVADGVCSMAMITLHGGPFLVAFAVELGASNYEVGLLTSIAFLSQPMQLLGLVLVQRFPHRRGITVICAALSRMAWLLIASIPLLFIDHGVTFLLQWLLIAGLIGVIPGPAWGSWIRDLVPQQMLGRLVATRLVWGTGIALVLTLAGGQFIDYWQRHVPDAPLLAYTILFTASVMAGFIGVVVIARMPERTMEVQRGTPLGTLLLQPLQNTNYRQLLMFMALWNFAINMATPFFIVYMLKRIGLSLALVTMLIVLSQLSNMLSLRIWGRLADRFSNTSVLAVSGPLFLCVVLAWTLTTMPERYLLTIPLLCVIHIMSGIAMAGITLGTSNIALKLAPHGLAHSYLTVFGLAGAATGAVAPLVGGLLADVFAARELSLMLHWSSPARQLSMYALNFRALDFLFLLTCVVGMVAIQWLGRVREEGEVEEREVLDDLVGSITTPLRTAASIEGMKDMALLPLDRFLRRRGQKKLRR